MQKLPHSTLSYHAALKYAARERLLQLQRAQLREQARQRRAHGGTLPKHIQSGFGSTTTITDSKSTHSRPTEEVILPEGTEWDRIAMFRAQRSKRRLLNPAMEQDFKPSDRVAVLDLPTLRSTYPATKTMKGRIGTVREVRRLAEMCIVDGLEPGKSHAFPFEVLRPVRTLPPSPPASSSSFSSSKTPSSTKEQAVEAEAEKEEEVVIYDAGTRIPGPKPKKRRPTEPPRRQRYPPLPKTIMDMEFGGDMLHDGVEEVTWTPTLVKEPFPGSVIDELRNKHSRYKKMKAAREKKEEEKEQSKEMGLSGHRQRDVRRPWKKEVQYGGVLAEISKREQQKREREEAKLGTMPPEHVLEMIGRRMARAGVPLPSSRSATQPNTSATIASTRDKEVDELGAQGGKVRKTPAVAARESDEVRRAEKKARRDESARYWPVKGWKDRQRAAARQVEGSKARDREREFLRQVMVAQQQQQSRGGGGGGVVEARA